MQVPFLLGQERASGTSRAERKQVATNLRELEVRIVSRKDKERWKHREEQPPRYLQVLQRITRNVAQKAAITEH